MWRVTAIELCLPNLCYGIVVLLTYLGAAKNKVKRCNCRMLIISQHNMIVILHCAPITLRCLRNCFTKDFLFILHKYYKFLFVQKHSKTTHRIIQWCLFTCLTFLGGFISRICLTRSTNILSTLSFCLADASINVQQCPSFVANACPSTNGTVLWSPRSHLFPTRTTGTSVVSFTRQICSCISGISWKVPSAVRL